MVRREGEQRGEEWFLHFREFFARELQERFVPDAPVTVEIPGAVYRFVILAAQEPLDAGAAGVGSESHRTALRTAEEGGSVAFVAEYLRQLAAFAQRLGHQHERLFEGGDAAQYGGHGLDRAGAVGVHLPETEALPHERVEERRIARLRAVAVQFGFEVGRMFGRHAFQNENHHVAPFEVHGRRVGAVGRGEIFVQFFGRKVAGVFDRSAAADGPQNAEGVAQDQVGLFAGRGVERGVREGDRAGHARYAAPHAGDAEQNGDHQQSCIDRVINPALAQGRSGCDLASVTPNEQPDEDCADEEQVPVFGGEFQHELHRIGVVGEEDFVGGETLLRIAEIDAIGQVYGHDQQRIDHRIVPEENTPIPAPLPEMERQQREDDEKQIGVENRYGVELQTPPRQCQDPGGRSGRSCSSKRRFGRAAGRCRAGRCAAGACSDYYVASVPP